MAFHNLKKYLAKGSFASNLLITSVGSSAAYLIGLLFTPVISRIYGPEAYGAFSVFNSLVINLSIIASLGYEQAVIIPNKREDFYGIIKLNIYIILCFSICLLLLIVVVPNNLLAYFNLLTLKKWILFLPLLIALNVTSQVFTTISIKYKSFSTATRSRIISVIGTKGYALSHGLLYRPNVNGFIIGEILGKGVFIFWLMMNKKVIQAAKISFKIVNLKVLKQVAKAFDSYPKYNLPGVWMVTLTAQLPTFAMLKFFDAESVGYYSMASMLLFVPLNLVSRSMSTVFVEKASGLFNSKNIEELKRVSFKMIKNLAIVGILAVIIILFLSEFIFTTLLGKKWLISGIFAKYLCLYLFSELIAFPLGVLYRVLRIEKTYLIYSLISFLITVLILYTGSRFGSIYIFVFSISIARFIDNSIKSIVVLTKLRSIQK